ncbi:hypothetical protein NMY22_g4684 [Coprinellus aureogranulatus]|nr:hypothetical protein NMY22_g4684 [Coprinellus aureogranulatus]
MYMPNALPQDHATLVSTLQRAIYLSFSSDPSGSAPSPTRHGSGWLYELEDGKVYFSPNCHRFGLRLPPPLHLSNGGPLAGRDYDTQLIRQAQWWTKMHGYMAFTPLSPDFSAPPLYPLLYLPQVMHEVGLGPHPEGPAWVEWIDLERRTAQSISLLLGASGAPAVRPAFPCARVTATVNAKGGYKGRKRELYRDMSDAKAWFSVWFGCLSYAIAVSDALIQDANNFAGSVPPTWIDILLQDAGGTTDWTFISHLRNTCIAQFDSSIERTGVFVEFPDCPEDVISIDFLCNHNVPVFYRWGSREERLSEKYPSLRRYRPTVNAARVPTNGQICSLPQSPRVASSAFAEFEALLGRSRFPQGPGHEAQRQWFLSAKIREEVLKVTETDEERARREDRQRNPPTDPSKTKFYVWDTTGAQEIRRRVARDEDIKGLFKREGRFGKQQARYNAFFNEWDLSHDFGPPDEDQIECLAEAFMDGEIASLQEEVSGWRVYFNVDGIGGRAPTPTLTSSAVTSTAGCTPSELERRVEPPDQTHAAAHLNALGSLVSLSTIGQERPSSAESLKNGCLEDGEVEEAETSTPERGKHIHWKLESSGSTPMIAHAYEHFGFTVPLGAHPSTSLPKIEPQFTYRIVRGYVPGIRDNNAFWNSREGQALIRFSMSLCNTDHPPGYSWDLSKENQTPVLSLSRAKYLRSAKVQIPDSKSPWNNVVGRRAVQPPGAQVPQQTQNIYWFDIEHGEPWLLGSCHAAHALTLCRLNAEMDPLALAWTLARRGIPFQTWFECKNVSIPSTIRRSPHLVQFQPENDDTFSQQDYEVYIRQRRHLLNGPAARGAIRKGGIVWRLAMCDIGLQDSLVGPPSRLARQGGGGVYPVSPGRVFVDDELDPDEVDAICGHYDLGRGGQVGRVSWWPPAELWEAKYGNQGWCLDAEHEYLRRMEEIDNGSAQPLSRSAWRGILRTSSKVLRAFKNLEMWSERLCNSKEDGGF